MIVRYDLLQPVDIGGQIAQGFQTGRTMVKEAQTQNALRAFVANPDDPAAFNALAAFNPDAAMNIARLHAARDEMQQKKRDRERAVSLGELYTKDPQGAQEEALAAGDFDLAKTFSTLSKEQQARLHDMYKGAAPLAYEAKKLPYEQRKAYIESLRPQLRSLGWDDQRIDAFDPSNANLDGIVQSSMTLEQAMDSDKVTWHQQGESPSFATDSMGRPVGSANPAVAGGGSLRTPTAPAANAVAATLSTVMPPHVVAGFLGNFDAEGGYGGAQGDGGMAHGIAQWRGERQTNFQRVIGKPVAQASPEEQARFVLWEMQNPEAAGMTVEQRDAILNARNPAEAADLIDRFYERSDGRHRQRRVEAAARFAGGAGAPVAVATKAEYDRLPSGTSYVAPDGSQRMKP